MALSSKEIRLALQDALIGEIYENIRAITFAYNPDIKNFKLRYYLDRKPTADDYENADCVLTEFMANFKYSEFKEMDVECIKSIGPIRDVMDGMVFRRKE